MKRSRIVLLAAAAAMTLSMSAARAESDINTGAGAGLSASARLDFRIVVPRIIFLRVGTGTDFADVTTIDRVDFTLTPADVGSGTPIAGASGSGAYPVPVRVLGNGGNVSLTATGTAGGLSNGTETVAWTEITRSTSNAALPNPVIGNGVPGAASTLTATAGVVNLSANWTYSYANAAPIAFGTYNGQVTYTAALP